MLKTAPAINLNTGTSQVLVNIWRGAVGRFCHLVRDLPILLIPIASALVAFAPGNAEASNVRFTGYTRWDWSGDRAIFASAQVANTDAAGVSGGLRFELWALSAPYGTAGAAGYKLAVYALSPIAAGGALSYIDSGWVPYAPPPVGTWNSALLLTEFTGASTNDGYTVDDYINGQTQVFVGVPGTITPVDGLWANANELGTGYTLGFKHGVLVVAIYAYQTGGPAQWYLASGPVVNNVFTATLDKYVGGQCISCTFTGQPMLIGNDGIITITFASSTSATVNLPGGRVTQIAPFRF